MDTIQSFLSKYTDIRDAVKKHYDDDMVQNIKRVKVLNENQRHTTSNISELLQLLKGIYNYAAVSRSNLLKISNFSDIDTHIINIKTLMNDTFFTMSDGKGILYVLAMLMDTFQTMIVSYRSHECTDIVYVKINFDPSNGSRLYQTIQEIQYVKNNNLIFKNIEQEKMEVLYRTYDLFDEDEAEFQRIPTLRKLGKIYATLYSEVPLLLSHEFQSVFCNSGYYISSIETQREQFSNQYVDDLYDKLDIWIDGNAYASIM